MFDFLEGKTGSAITFCFGAVGLACAFAIGASLFMIVPVLGMMTMSAVDFFTEESGKDKSQKVAEADALKTSKRETKISSQIPSLAIEAPGITPEITAKPPVVQKRR